VEVGTVDPTNRCSKSAMYRKLPAFQYAALMPSAGTQDI
jgi:hypothetical protein